MGARKYQRERQKAIGGFKSGFNGKWLVFLAVCVLVISGFTIWNAAGLQRAVHERTESYVEDVSVQLSNDIDNRLSKVTLDLEMLEDSLLQADLSSNQETLKAFLDRKADILGFTSMIILDAKGGVYESNPIGVDYFSLPGIQDSLAGKKGVPFLNQQGVLYSIPVIEGGQITGVLAGVRNKENMQKLIQAQSFDGNGLTCITDLNGNVIISPTNLEPFMRLDDIFVKQSDERVLNNIYQMQENMKNRQKGTFTFTAADQTNLVLSYSPLASYDWVLLTLVPADLISHETDRYVFQTYIVIAGTIALFIIILIILVRVYRNHYKELQYTAFTDRLTGEMNNAAFQIKCQSLFPKSPPGTYAVALLNIKNFKLINENFGSGEGNRTLDFMMKIMKSYAGPEEFVARADGDNFFFCMKENDPEVIRERLNQVTETLNDRFKISTSAQEAPFHLMIHQGVYLVDDPGLEITVIQDRAKTACRSRAAQVDNLCVFYDAEFTRKLIREHELNDQFESSLQNGEFQVYLQPKVWVDNGVPGAAEALIRWRHPQQGLISPGDFIPVFEKSDRICQLDFYVFQQVCKFLRARLDAGKSVFPISVNLSRRHFKDPEALSKLKKIAGEYEIPENILELELTESVFFDDQGISHVKGQIEEMHRMGFRCSLDDFGAGFSSLGLLMEFDVDVIKLDRRFFLAVGKEKTRDVVASITDLAEKLGIKTVAEGIETQEQLEFVRQVRCDMIQGYLYAKPMPVSEFECWLEQRQSAPKNRE